MEKFTKVRRYLYLIITYIKDWKKNHHINILLKKNTLVIWHSFFLIVNIQGFQSCLSSVNWNPRKWISCEISFHFRWTREQWSPRSGSTWTKRPAEAKGKQQWRSMMRTLLAPPLPGLMVSRKKFSKVINCIVNIHGYTKYLGIYIVHGSKSINWR